MAKVDGFYHIIGVGGVTNDANGNEVPATPDNVAKHFPQPLPYEEPEYKIDTDGDGVPDTTFKVGPVEMPMMPPPDYSDGFGPVDMPTMPGPEDSEEFKRCAEFAKENGLTAVLVEPRQDVGSDGRLTGITTMAWIEPTVIYLDKDGNEVDPEGAPGYGILSNIDLGDLETSEGRIDELRGELTTCWGDCVNVPAGENAEAGVTINLQNWVNNDADPARTLEGSDNTFDVMTPR